MHKGIKQTFCLDGRCKPQVVVQFGVGVAEYECNICHKRHPQGMICPNPDFKKDAPITATECLKSGLYGKSPLLERLDDFKAINDVAKQIHYTQFKIQPITFIVENKLSYNQGNVIKYVCRHGSKNGVEDLKKAKVYIDYMIQELETGTVKP